MKILSFPSKEELFEARVGKITGSKVKNVLTFRGTGKKAGYYELIVDRIGVKRDEEDVRDRGTRLEEESLKRFQAITDKKLKTGYDMWVREDNEDIAVSPDAWVEPKKGAPITEAVETKSLSSASHIEAFLTQEVPTEYRPQTIQYFASNDDLIDLYVCFYDPSLLYKDFFYLKVSRESIQKEIDEYLEQEKAILKEIKKIVLDLSF